MTIVLVGSDFPTGLISPGNVTVSIMPAHHGSGPSASTTALTVTPNGDGDYSVRRVTFIIPPVLIVSVPTPYFVSISGTTAQGRPFASENPAALTIDAPAAANLSITKTHTHSFTQGQGGATYTVTVSNASGAAATSGVVTVTETVPAGMTLASMVGTGAANGGWTCTVLPTCTRNDALAGGASYPTITVTVNVGAGAGSPLVNHVSVSGGGSATANANDSTVVVPTADLSGCLTGGEALLNGKYAFLVRGFQGGIVNNLTPMALAGSFAADGHGNITGGEEDLNGTVAGASQHVTISSTSFYMVGPDNRGCLVLAYSGGTTTSAVFRFALGAVAQNGAGAGIASKGRIIEFDDPNDTGTRGSGQLRFQTQSAFVASQLQARYAFGFDGGDFSGGHFSIAGSFSFNSGTGNISALTADSDDAGTLASIAAGTGTISGISATTGRGVLTLTSGSTKTYAMYIIGPSAFFVVATDTFNGTTPIVSGSAIVTPGSYTAASASGKVIVHLTGRTAGVADVNLGLLTLTPGAGNSGTVSGTIQEYNATGGAQSNPLPGGATYTVDPATGRTTLTVAGNKTPIIYLTTATDGIVAFLEGTDTDAQFGFAEAQPTVGLPTGNYVLGSEDPEDSTVHNFVGVITVGAAGATNFTEDQSDGGLTVDATFAVTQTTNADGTGTFGGPTFYITNGTNLFFIFESGSAVIEVIE